MDFKTYCLDELKKQDLNIDPDLAGKFIEFSQSAEPFPIPIDFLVQDGIYDLRGYVKRVMERMDYREGVDFYSHKSESTGGRPRIITMLSNACYKGLCLLAQNAKGRQIHRYFIAIEQLWMVFMQTTCAELKEQIQVTNKTLTAKEKQIYALMRRHKSVEASLGTARAGFYIISDAHQDLCSDDCCRPSQYKAGIDTVNVAHRLDQHRTDIPALRVDYLVYLRASDCELLEKALLRKYEEHRFPYINHEWIFNMPVSNMIVAVKHIIKYLNMEAVEDPNITTINDQTNHLLTLRADEEKDEHEELKAQVNAVSSRLQVQAEVQSEIISSLKNMQTKINHIEVTCSELEILLIEIKRYKLNELKDLSRRFNLPPRGNKINLREKLENAFKSALGIIDSQELEEIEECPLFDQNDLPRGFSLIYESDAIKGIKARVGLGGNMYETCFNDSQVLLSERFIQAWNWRQALKNDFKSTGKVNWQAHERQTIRPKICLRCDTSVSPTSSLCQSCAAKSESARPSKEELVALLTTHKGNFSAVGRELNRTDAAVRKWLKEYEFTNEQIAKRSFM
jgi:phage anti-repressor protein